MKTFVPTQDVQYSNISVSIKEFTVTLDVRTRKQGNKRWSKANRITAKLSYHLYNWLIHKRVLLNSQDKNSQKITGFQKYLVKQGIEFHPGILSTMKFESSNLSEVYAENPFKLIAYEDGAYSITLVHLKNKVKETNGNWTNQKNRYYSKACFRRLIYVTAN